MEGWATSNKDSGQGVGMEVAEPRKRHHTTKEGPARQEQTSRLAKPIPRGRASVEDEGQRGRRVERMGDDRKNWEKGTRGIKKP